jgi:hypothetical protein
LDDETLALSTFGDQNLIGAYMTQHSKRRDESIASYRWINVAAKVAMLCITIFSPFDVADALFNSRLNYFACENISQAQACNKCKPEKNIALQVEVNQAAQAVIIKFLRAALLQGP